ncbi:MAG: hypothetical protein JSS20_12785 [Proteobacteria bacterium]|nr:hypothetical protein [Pseudomonadota bacterium]
MTARANMPAASFFLEHGGAAQFSDDELGRDTRIMLAGHSELLSDMVKGHAPIAQIMKQVRKINDILNDGLEHEIGKLLSEASGAETLQ